MVIRNSKQIESLIMEYNPDVVKCDIEGAEVHLLGVYPKIVSSVSQWLVEAHNQKLFAALPEFFRSLGYQISVHYEVQNVKVIYARRD